MRKTIVLIAADGAIGASVHLCVARTAGPLPANFDASVVPAAGVYRNCALHGQVLRQIAQYLPGEAPGPLYFQRSLSGFQYNLLDSAEYIEHFKTDDAPIIADLNLLETTDAQRDYAALDPVGGSQGVEASADRQTLQITNHAVHAANKAKYRTLRFEVFAYKPRAVRPAFLTGFKHTLYEPFFSFGSGTGLFPCVRPLDKQKESWPIVCQDYDITFQRRLDRGLFGMLSHFETISSSLFNDDMYELQALPMSELVREYTIVQDAPLLISNSFDSGIQSEKDISVIQQYAPKIIPFESIPLVFSTGMVGTTQMLYLDRGFPSFFFIRMEWEPTGATAGFIPRAGIQSINFKLFTQENAYTSKLSENELYYLSRQNCHKYCGFQELWDYENAVLLRLEDIGLMTEQVGYPVRKRLELEVRVTWSTNFGLREYFGYTGKTEADIADKPLRLRTVLIYENSEFIGDSRRSEFVEQYM